MNCSVSDCAFPVYSFYPATGEALCNKHYQRVRRTGTTTRYGGRSSLTTCLRCGAEFRVEANQRSRGEGKYCSRECKHAASRGVERVTGTRYISKSGYVTVKTGIRQYQLEHRLLMEQSIGRKLTTDEQVHHINGDRIDNRIENLQLLTNAEHQKLHDHLDVQHPPRTVTLVCEICAVEYQTRPSRASTSSCCSQACRLIKMRASRKHRP